MTLHINLLYGKNSHHMVEAVFKGFGRALKEAVSLDERSCLGPLDQRRLFNRNRNSELAEYVTEIGR